MSALLGCNAEVISAGREPLYRNARTRAARSPKTIEKRI
jgi:hypothetical protein